MPVALRHRKPRTRRSLSALDLFAGCGGLTLGLRRAGFHVRGAVEIDPDAVRMYRANHPTVAIWDTDIRRLSGKEILRRLQLRRGSLDLLAGCPPCQGFSSLRTLNGRHRVSDRQNDLIFQFLRLIRVLRPRTVLLENVPGLASDTRLARFCVALRRLAYNVASGVQDAADFGIPQRRRRFVLLASRIGEVSLPTPSGDNSTVRSSISALDLAGTSGDPIHDLPENRSDRVREIIAFVPRDGGSRTQLPARLHLRCHRQHSGFYDVYGRMAWDAVAPTITTGCFNPSKGRFLHPEFDRNITLREAALLQGFPRSYRFHVAPGKIVVARLIGNAIPPGFAVSHARILRGLLRRMPTARDGRNLRRQPLAPGLGGSRSLCVVAEPVVTRRVDRAR